MPTLTGTVADGYGAASRDVQAGVYRLLGDLAHGTLNLQLEAPLRIVDLGPPTHVVRFAGIDRMLWPAVTSGLGVWVLWATHLGDTVEILADRHLRTALELSTGDRLKVTV